jgi:transportin-3
LALAALALQLNQSGIVDEILGQLNPIIPIAPHILLELLTVLPEECFNNHIDVDDGIREMFSEQLTQSIAQVLEFMCSFIPPEGTDLSQGNPQTYTQLLRCLCGWIQHTRISQTAIASHPILAFALKCLHDRGLFDEAVDVMVCLMRKFSGPACLDDDMVLAHVLIPNIFALSELWNDDEVNSQMHDEDVCRGVSRVFTELVESFLLIVTMDEDIGQEQLFRQLLKGAAYPWDFDIARIPLKGFYELSAFIKNCGQERARLESSYGNIFCELIQVCLRQKRLREEAVRGQQEISSQEEYTRDELNESIIDAIDVVGASEALGVVLAELDGAVTASSRTGADISSWIDIEACLSSVEVITSFLSDEASAEPLIQIMQFLITLPQDSLPALDIVRNRLVGRSSSFLATQPQFLPPLMEFISQGLMSPLTVASSSLAIMNLFKNCRPSHSLLQLDMFYAQVCQLREAGQLPVGSDIDILEGLCFVMAGMDIEESLQALNHTTEPIITALQQHIATKASSKLVIEDLDRLTILLSHASASRVTDRHPGVEMFKEIWPILQQTMNDYPKELVCEKACRCFKHMLRNAKLHALPIMESMTYILAEEFESKPFACFLYSASNCIATIGDCCELDKVSDEMVLVAGIRVGQLKQATTNMFHIMSTSFFTRHSSLAEFDQNPDVVEEYFYLMARVLHVIPHMFLEYEEALTVISAGVTGLQLKHREAQKGILLFFERLVGVPLALSRAGEVLDTSHAMQRAQEIVHETLVPLTTSLIASLSGQMPAYALDESYGSIADVLWSLKQLYPEEFYVSANM